MSEVKEHSKFDTKGINPKSVDFKPFNFPERILQMDLTKHYPKKEKFYESDPELIQKAYLKILEMWNKNDKSRSFIKHLIASFLPYDNFMRMMNLGKSDVKCAILGLPLLGIGEISKGFSHFSTEKMIIDAHAMSEERNEYTKEELEKLDTLKKEMPDAVKNSWIAIHSESSDKYLMVEANLALLNFTEQMILLDVPEFNFLLKKMRLNKINNLVPKEKQMSQTQVNKVVKATTFGIGHSLDNGTLVALQNLKKQLEESEK